LRMASPAVNKPKLSIVKVRVMLTNKLKL
jgi:hypothetical protein